MSKRRKHSGRAARDVHAIIREQAAALKRRPPDIGAVPPGMPELQALMLAGLRALSATPPPPSPPPLLVFAFAGRFYWLQLQAIVRAEVFDSPRASAPLFSTLCHAEPAPDSEPPT